MSDAQTFFLVIEGLDGSGKSEISRRLAELMRATLENRVMLTFEPHDPSAAGLYIRRVLRKKILVSPHTLALAFALNRSDHNERVIGPFLEQNEGPRLVLCDRYVLSSLVYNTSHNLSMHEVWELNSGARRPDLTLFLDASAEICYARMGSRGGNRELFESNLSESRTRYFEAIDFLRQRHEQVVVVDANPDLLTVINSIIDVLRAVGPRWLTLQKLMFLEATAPAILTPPPLELDRWMRDFIDRYTIPVLAEAARDDGVRRLVANEVDSLSLDELTALMMNFLQTDRRYRFESAWPGQPIDYTVIRPGGESGGLVILQDERRWEGVMRALESEFIAPHYSIRRDSIQFVVALDPSHAGEEVAQFVPDTGSVPVEVYGRGTLIQHFTRYITRRIAVEHTPAVESMPQLSMPLPDGEALTDDWSLAAAHPAPEVEVVPEEPVYEEDAPLYEAIVLEAEAEGDEEVVAYEEPEVLEESEAFEESGAYEEPVAYEEPEVFEEQEGYETPVAEDEPPPVRPSRTATQEMWFVQQDYVPAPEAYHPVAEDYYLEQDLAVDDAEAWEPAAVDAETATIGEVTDEQALEPLVMDFDTGEIAVLASALLHSEPEAAADIASAPVPEAENPWSGEPAPPNAPVYSTEAGEYPYVPAPETELPLGPALTPADIDTGADVVAEYAFAPWPDAGLMGEPEPTPSKWDTQDDLAAVAAEEPTVEPGAAEPRNGHSAEAVPEPTLAGFDFDLPGAGEGHETNGLMSFSQSEMDAIAALYSGLDDALRAAEEEEPFAGSEEEEPF